MGTTTWSGTIRPGRFWGGPETKTKTGTKRNDGTATETRMTYLFWDYDLDSYLTTTRGCEGDQIVVTVLPPEEKVGETCLCSREKVITESGQVHWRRGECYSRRVWRYGQG